MLLFALEIWKGLKEKKVVYIARYIWHGPDSILNPSSIAIDEFQHRRTRRVYEDSKSKHRFKKIETPLF